MAMNFSDPPAVAAFEHRDAQRGFEVVFIQAEADGYGIKGHTAAIEDGQAFAAEYAITLDADWVTRSAQVRGRSATGEHELMLEADGAGHWTMNGEPAPELDGYLDVDLEASAFTNAFPIHRLGLAVGEGAEAPAVYVRELDLAVERLEQSYRRLPDDGARRCYHYESPRFDFEAELVYDEAGLILDYPGIGVRAI
jgi:hypothetical protein